MSLMADALQPLLVNGILTIDRRIESTSIPDAIVSPRAAYDLDFDDQTSGVVFDFRDRSLIVTATAADCCRLSGSAFQTVSSLAEDSFEKNAIPWTLIKLYYAAFYAGQTIIRLLGEGCSFLDVRHISRIDEFGKATGKAPGFKVDAGLYRCAIDAGATKLTCIRIPGGTHESFWGVFGERMHAATNSVLSGPLAPGDAQAVFGQLEAFGRLIRRHGTYRWLSALRNDLQYRHQYDVWFPSGLGKKELGALGRLASQWKSDPMAMSLDGGRFGTLGEFSLACAFILAVCRALLTRIVERSPIKRSFLHYGPVGFIQ